MRLARTLLVAAALLAVWASGAQAALLGPTPYTSISDSPFFAFGDFTYFFLENFDDHVLNTPGVTASAGNTAATVGFNGSIIDQVGLAGGCPSGGLSVACDTWFGAGQPGVVFTFDADVLGALPDAVGIVWTDGEGTITFEAFDQNGVSLGTLIGTHADGSFFGTIGDDRFYGVTNPGGISSIHISNTSGGIEVDDLQYGRRGEAAVPEPHGLLLLAVGLLALGARAMRS
jgi:hypothetical protein